MTVFMCGGKTNAAVTHDNSGGAVPTTWCEPWIPRCLRVVVRVNVYPTWCEKETIGIHNAMRMCSRCFACWRDFTNDAVFKHHIGCGFWCTRAIYKAGITNDCFLAGLLSEAHVASVLGVVFGLVVLA